MSCWRGNPGLMIDNCSSGGRRIDLEMISRSIALWRSDFQCYPEFDPVSQQGQTQGLAGWVPLSTGCSEQSNDYAFRSALGPGVAITNNIWARDAVDFAPVDWLRERMVELKALRPYFYGDFYPLLSYTLSNDLWAAWQWHRADMAAGCVLAFRRPQSPIVTIEPALHGLDPAAEYEVRDLDTGQVVVVPGSELAAGLTIRIGERPGTRALVYRKV